MTVFNDASPAVSIGAPANSKLAREFVLLCDGRHGGAQAIDSHIGGLVAGSRHKIRVVSMLGDIPPRLELTRFDAVIVHYTLITNHRSYLSTQARSRLAAYPGLKAVFAQDEYRWVNSTIDLLREVGANLLLTCVPQQEIEKVYPEDKLPHLIKINVLTGYVDNALVRRAVPSWNDRPIDIGYRTREVPAWLGALGQEKVRIGQRWAADAAGFGLKTNISCREEDRLYGEDWTRFLTRCKAILGVESGASVFDFSGAIMRDVEDAQLREPQLTFEELQQRYFKDMEGLISVNQISPRCFEAAALRTLMILDEGEYSQRLVPWRHYVPLRKDHSNAADVARILRDPGRAEQMIETAYREVACNPINSYKALATIVDAAIEQALGRLAWKPAQSYGELEFRHQLVPSLRERSMRAGRSAFNLLHSLIFGKALGMLPDRPRTAARSALKRLYRAVISKFTRG